MQWSILVLLNYQVLNFYNHVSPRTQLCQIPMNSWICLVCAGWKVCPTQGNSTRLFFWPCALHKLVYFTLAFCACAYCLGSIDWVSTCVVLRSKAAVFRGENLFSPRRNLVGRRVEWTELCCGGGGPCTKTAIRLRWVYKYQGQPLPAQMLSAHRNRTPSRA